MRLADLEPRLLRLSGHDGRVWNTEHDLAKAHGVKFLCPKCLQANGGPVGTHAVVCWFTGVPDSVPPGPGRWSPSGSGVHDLTLTAPSSSVLLPSTDGGCGAHFFVRNGAIEWCR